MTRTLNMVPCRWSECAGLPICSAGATINICALAISASGRSPDGSEAKSGTIVQLARPFPDFASLHPGYMDHSLRAPDQRQRRRRVKPPIIERATRDGARKLSCARRKECTHILERRETARGNHWDRDRVRERNGGVEIEALEQAVARNVGVDDRRNARILEAARDVERRELGRLRPALDRDLAVARIETDRYAARKRAGGALHQL